MKHHRRNSINFYLAIDLKKIISVEVKESYLLRAQTLESVVTPLSQACSSLLALTSKYIQNLTMPPLAIATTWPTLSV